MLLAQSDAADRKVTRSNTHTHTQKKKKGYFLANWVYMLTGWTHKHSPKAAYGKPEGDVGLQRSLLGECCRMQD